MAAFLGRQTFHPLTFLDSQALDVRYVVKTPSLMFTPCSSNNFFNPLKHISQIGSSPQVGVRKHMIFTLSPIIMVQWKTAIFKNYLRGNCCSRYIHFSLNHDYGRIREKPSFIFHRIHGTIVYLPTFTGLIYGPTH